MVFEDYAKYYNLLYKDKDYRKEVDYIAALINQHSGKTSKTVLDIGCGTGLHASYLSQLGFFVTGIDLSPDMIGVAKSNQSTNTEFFVSDATNFSLNRQFNIVLSLFHVVSYQTTNEDVIRMFKNVHNHLKDDGIFIFDFWYGPAVLTEKPAVRIKRLDGDEFQVLRLAEPEIDVNSNLVNVNYDLHISYKKKSRSENVKETHRMRYFFIPELNHLLSDCGLKVVKYEEWLTGDSPSEKTWGVCCIVKKNLSEDEG